MALSDTINTLRAISPFIHKRFGAALLEVLDEIEESSGGGAAIPSGDISEDSLVAARIEATSLAIVGNPAGSRIGGGFVTGITALGGSGGEDSIGGTFDNVVFQGAVNILDGVWTFNNCVFLSGFYASGGDIVLEGGACMGNATGNGENSSARLTLFRFWPSGLSYTLPVFEDPFA